MHDGNPDNIPPGYISVSLIEALNGPPQPSALMKHDLDVMERESNETDSQKAVEALNRDGDKLKDKRERNNQASEVIENSFSPIVICF